MTFADKAAFEQMKEKIKELEHRLSLLEAKKPVGRPKSEAQAA